MSKTIKQLIAEYDAAFEDARPKHTDLAELMHEASTWLHSTIRSGMRPTPNLELYEQLLDMQGRVPRGRPALELQDILSRLTPVKEAAKIAGKRLQAVIDKLEPEVREMNNRYIMEMAQRRSEMVNEIATAIAPFCESVNEAKEIAAACSRIRQLDFTMSQGRTIRDLRSAARSLSKHFEK